MGFCFWGRPWVCICVWEWLRKERYDKDESWEREPDGEVEPNWEKKVYKIIKILVHLSVPSQIWDGSVAVCQKFWDLRCKDSICNDSKLVLGSYVEGPNNKICRAWVSKN